MPALGLAAALAWPCPSAHGEICAEPRCPSVLPGAGAGAASGGCSGLRDPTAQRQWHGGSGGGTECLLSVKE